MALFISGVNRSDDLFMFYKGQVGGLQGGTTYQVSFQVEFATIAPSGCIGVGGAPGENVYIKAGATTKEPMALNQGGILRMNVDKGQQSSGGADAVVLGNVANSVPCGELPMWELKLLSGGTLLTDADEADRVWVYFGSDSGFESLSSFYYTQVWVTFEPL